MFSCKNLSVSAGSTKILSGVNTSFSSGAMHAVIGPSGCGKTTLVKAMLGIIPATGEVRFNGKGISGAGDLKGEVGFAPQFSIAHPKLTVEECLAYTLKLFVSDQLTREKRLESILKTIGLEEHRQKRVESLSGGQLRRIGLGLELTTDPSWLVCDEVTSGLDPLSEDQILELMRTLVEERDKTFVCIIHNLAKLERFDTVTVVYGGNIVFRGTPSALLEYFAIPDALRLYDRLNQRPSDVWVSQWQEESPKTDSDDPTAPSDVVQRPAMPGLFPQLLSLLSRRFLLFFRDKGYLFLTLAITLGFPLVVVVFAIDGLPQLTSPAVDTIGADMNSFRRLAENELERAQVGSLVTGLIMFQVILLTLMGSNNGAREIAGERQIFEKERFSGLSPVAYGLAKILFVGMIGLVQGFWMCAFVKTICGFPGEWVSQLIILGLCGVAMSMLSLGFSAVMRSAEKASLLSIYLVGFQLPLSGVVLALPEALVWICRPFINAYWAWSGYLSAMTDSRLYDAAVTSYTGDIVPVAIAAGVLSLHALVGIGITLYGCERKAGM